MTDISKAKKVKFAFVFQRPKTQSKPSDSPSLIHSLNHSLAHSFKKENLSSTCYIPGKVFMRKTEYVYFYRACILDQEVLELEESWPVLHTEVSARVVSHPSSSICWSSHTPHLCSATGSAGLTGLTCPGSKHCDVHVVLLYARSLLNAPNESENICQILFAWTMYTEWIFCIWLPQSSWFLYVSEAMLWFRQKTFSSFLVYLDISFGGTIWEIIEPLRYESNRKDRFGPWKLYSRSVSNPSNLCFLIQRTTSHTTSSWCY